MRHCVPFTRCQQRAPCCSGNIYPVGSADVPFLGVHFTPRVDGTLWLGPNAVPAFCREGYTVTYADVNVRELVDLLLFPGTWRVLVRHARFGIGETYRSLSIAAQVKELPVWDGICVGVCLHDCL